MEQKQKRLSAAQRKARRRKRFIHNVKRYTVLVLLFAIVCGLCIGAGAGIGAIIRSAGDQPERAEESEPEHPAVDFTEPATLGAGQAGETEEQRQLRVYGCKLYGDYEYPFDTMSQDWDDVTGFYYHEISDEAKAAGGEFPVIAQVYTYILCRDYGVDYEIVFALIEHESKFVWDAVGDGGKSVGYMQIYERWHADRMERLNCTDLTNPFQNIRVGVDYLAYLQDRTEDTADMLAAYNYGLTGARENLWAYGVNEYRYNREIMERAQQLKNETEAAWEGAMQNVSGVCAAE